MDGQPSNADERHAGSAIGPGEWIDPTTCDQAKADADLAARKQALRVIANSLKAQPTPAPERRLGELAREMPKNRGGAEQGIGRRGKQCGSQPEPHSSPPTLAQVGIDKKLSARAQKLAAMPEAPRERYILTLEPELDRLGRDPIQRLRSWLKLGHRGFSLRCVDAREQAPANENSVSTRDGARP